MPSSNLELEGVGAPVTRPLQARASGVVAVVVKRVLPLDADRPGPGVAAAGVAQVEVVLGRGKEGDAAAEDLAGLQRRDPGLQAALKGDSVTTSDCKHSITQKCGPFVKHPTHPTARAGRRGADTHT